MLSAAYWIDHLQLLQHPEGGYYKRTYEGTFSSIYFLMTAAGFSALHRLQSTEIWNFHVGLPVELYYIEKDGRLVVQKLGGNYGFQAIVPAQTWLAARVSGEGYSLCGCTVIPKFRFEDFELAKRSELTAVYPQHRALIHDLTRS